MCLKKGSSKEVLTSCSLCRACTGGDGLLSYISLSSTESGAIFQHKDDGQLSVPTWWRIVVRVSRVEQEAGQVDVVEIGSWHIHLGAIQWWDLVARLQNKKSQYEG